MVKEGALNIFTDGSSFSHPRSGGIGIRFVTINAPGNEVVEDIEPVGYPGATNNQMELQACIEGLKLAVGRPDISTFTSIEIVTDSRYVVDNVDSAKFQWPKTQWKLTSGKPVENAEQWKDLVRLLKKSPQRVHFHWVKGHAKNIHNKAVDKAAKRSAKNPFNKPISVVSVRRKTTNKSVELGSVRMTGQTLTIRIITDQFLKIQRVYKYKYEVISVGSEFFGLVDIAFSDHLLRAGHHYEVVFNDESENPRILEVMQELER